MILPKSPPKYDVSDQDQLRNALEVGISTLEQRPNTSQWGTDRGDNSVTLNAGTDAEIQRFATALTANRTITLGSGFVGAKFRIVRTGHGVFRSADGVM